MITEAGVVIPDLFIDRAHRVGKKNTLEDGTVQQQLIVRFTTWRHRTLLYRNRAKLQNAKIHLDLTKGRFKFLKHCQVKVKDHPKVSFIFADMNCNKCIRLASGQFKYFTTEDEVGWNYRRSIIQLHLLRCIFLFSLLFYYDVLKSSL